MFCDEINLPDMDAYGTQRVISFLRQLVEYNGFYRVSDQVCSLPWIIVYALESLSGTAM